MKVSKKMAEALLTTGQYRTKKYLYELGPNMYGQERCGAPRSTVTAAE